MKQVRALMSVNFNADLQDEVLAWVSEGGTVAAFQRERDMPTLRSYIVAERIANEEFRYKYWEAQKAQQEHFQDQVLELANQSLVFESKEEMSAAATLRRTQVDALKWVAGRMASSQGCKNFKGNFKKKRKAVGKALETGMMDIKTGTTYLEYVDKEADITEKTEIIQAIKRHSLTSKKDKI